MNSGSGSGVKFLARFRNQLLGLVLLVFVPVFLLTIHNNVKERQREKQSTRHETIATVKLAVAKQETFVKAARKLLTTVSQFEFLVATTNRMFSEIHFKNLRQLYPEYLDIGLIESNGTLFCSTIITNGTPNLSGWSCFKRVMEGRRFSMGDLETAGTTPEETLDFGLPILDEKGAVKRVFFASLNISEFRRVATEIELRDGANLMVIDGNGSLLAQHPRLPTSTQSGKSLVQYPYLTTALKKNQTVFETKDNDRVEKLYAIAGVGDGSKNRFWVSVDVPTAAAFAGADQSLRKNILIMSVIACIALVAAYFYSERFFLRPLRALTEEAQLLAAGKWTSRALSVNGKGELADLSKNFQEMALALEEQRSCLEKSNIQLEQRVLERTSQLEQAGKELEAFSYSVSHDLRSPIRHISGFVDMLRCELGNSVNEKSARYLNIIADSAKQMGQLIDDLLVFSRMGRVEMQKTVVDADQLIRTTITNLEPETKNRNICWEISALPRMQADPSMLRQVFVNLLSNAIKYSQPRDPARIQVGHEEAEKEIIVFIRDNGVGFDMQFADKLFGVFQRLHRHDEFEGTGIGLANVRRIINRHGGRTWAEGKLGEGATFYFSLPRSND